MRIFITGATGVLGRRVVPRLVAGGHEVAAVARTHAKAAAAPPAPSPCACLHQLARDDGEQPAGTTDEGGADDRTAAGSVVVVAVVPSRAAP